MESITEVPEKPFKVQVPSTSGWCDLKENVDGTDDYKTCYYESEEAAHEDMRPAVEHCEDFEYRVVPSEQEAEGELY